MLTCMAEPDEPRREPSSPERPRRFLSTIEGRGLRRGEDSKMPRDEKLSGGAAVCPKCGSAQMVYDPDLGDEAPVACRSCGYLVGTTAVVKAKLVAEPRPEPQAMALHRAREIIKEASQDTGDDDSAA